MTDKKKSFLLYLDTLEILKKLTDEQAGKLLKAFLAYHSDQDLDLDPMLDLVFFSFKAQFERDSIKYQNIVDRNKSNGSKGGRPKNPVEPKEPSGLSGNPSKPKEPDSVSGNDSDSDSDNDTNNITSLKNDGFEHWWKLYPKKVGKKKAETRFKSLTKKMNEESFMIFIDLISLDTNKRFSGQEQQFILHPTTYLNEERWNDE